MIRALPKMKQCKRACYGNVHLCSQNKRKRVKKINLYPRSVFSVGLKKRKMKKK